MTFDEIPADEEKFIEKLIQLLKAKMERENPDVMHRDAHPKMHGLVKAHFKVEEDIPPHLQHGVFKPGRTYKAWLRFSNQNAPPLPDIKKDIRGAAIKLMDVPGDKIAMPDNNTTSQDFILISTPAFVSKNVKGFCGLIQALVKGKLFVLLHFILHPRTAYNLYISNKQFYSPLEARYWSTTPYKLGDNQAVKYSLIPQNPYHHPIPKNPSDNYLRENLSSQLSENNFAFDFCVQVRNNPKKMPIEDPGKTWSEIASPFTKVATVEIPKQTFDTPEQNQWGLRLSFNPWHALPEHQPLGGINRARKIIYETLSKFRHHKNHQALIEPTDYTIPEEA